MKRTFNVSPVAYAGNLASDGDYSGSFCCAIQDEISQDSEIESVVGDYAVGLRTQRPEDTKTPKVRPKDGKDPWSLEVYQSWGPWANVVSKLCHAALEGKSLMASAL
jgi:hypothetical protein